MDITPMLRQKNKTNLLKLGFLIGGLLICISGFLLFISMSKSSKLPLTKLSEGIKLSNGQVINLGQPKDDLLQNVGSSLRSVSPGLYQYPGDPVKPVEVSIYVKDDKVTALFVTKNLANRTVLGNAGIGTSTAELKRNIPVGLTAINTPQDIVKQRGYKRTETNSAIYWLLPGCGDGERVVSVLLVLNGYTEALSPFSVPPSCAAGGNI